MSCIVVHHKAMTQMHCIAVSLYCYVSLPNQVAAPATDLFLIGSQQRTSLLAHVLQSSATIVYAGSCQ